MIKQILSQRGVGLIEVLITVLLLATVLLALSGLQLRSLQYNSSAYIRSQANIYAYDIIDRMRVSKLTPANYNIAIGTADPAGADQVSVDIREWRTNLVNAIAEAKSSINCNASRFCTISIQWGEQVTTAYASENTSTFVYSVQL